MYALAQFHRLPQVFEIQEPGGNDLDDDGGIDRLIESLPVRIKSSDIERLAIVIDADSDITSRWESIRSVLVPAGVALPRYPIATGTHSVLPDGKSVSIWIMPNNTLIGDLETFAAFLIPPEDALISRVDRFLDEIPHAERQFANSKRTKARIHTWLAIQKVPGKPLGQSITARYLDASLPIASQFVNWLRDALI
jgi:hypothetical protein